MPDMLTAFAKLAQTDKYIRGERTDTLTIKPFGAREDTHQKTYPPTTRTQPSKPASKCRSYSIDGKEGNEHTSEQRLLENFISEISRPPTAFCRPRVSA